MNKSNLPLITVFTPTYNRAYTLHLCYESLKRQTCKDFTWLIIDDGSTDNTQKLVDSWIDEDTVPIRYVYQENQGMHGAHNTAYELIDTELNMCIDSDDYLADDAIEKVSGFWRKYGTASHAGIVGLDATQSGEIIGTKMPETIKKASLIDLYEKHKVKGDKKLVYRSEITRKFPPYPLFPKEKYCPLSYKYILIDQEYPLLILNEVLCLVEYLNDGSSLNMMKQYKNNPHGFAFFRKTAIKFAPTFKARFRESIHFVSSNLLIKNYNCLSESPRKITTLFAIPFGYVLFLYVQYANNSHLENN